MPRDWRTLLISGYNESRQTSRTEPKLHAYFRLPEEAPSNVPIRQNAGFYIFWVELPDQAP